jgi:hypothetical protein
MVLGWRGYVWVLNKKGAFRDSAHIGLQASAGMVMKKYSHFVSFYMHIQRKKKSAFVYSKM